MGDVLDRVRVLDGFIGVSCRPDGTYGVMFQSRFDNPDTASIDTIQAAGATVERATVAGRERRYVISADGGGR